MSQQEAEVIHEERRKSQASGSAGKGRLRGRWKADYQRFGLQGNDHITHSCLTFVQEQYFLLTVTNLSLYERQNF